MHIEGIVESLFIGVERKENLSFTLEGIAEDKHQKPTKRVGPRENSLQLPRGNTIWNWRSWSAVSQEELASIAEKLDIPEVTPQHLLANICVSGIPEFTQLPAGSYLTLPSKLTLFVTGFNDPCVIPGNNIQETYPDFKPGHFVKKAKGLRGLVGVVLHPGEINEGDKIIVRPYTAQQQET